MSKLHVAYISVADIVTAGLSEQVLLANSVFGVACLLRPSLHACDDISQFSFDSAAIWAIHTRNN